MTGALGLVIVVDSMSTSAAAETTRVWLGAGDPSIVTATETCSDIQETVPMTQAALLARQDGERAAHKLATTTPIRHTTSSPA